MRDACIDFSRVCDRNADSGLCDCPNRSLGRPLPRLQQVLLVALKDLLHDWERTTTGFPQPLEVRFAVKDQAKAAIAAAEEARES